MPASRSYSADVNLHVANVTIQPVSVVRYLGVWLDSELTMKTHINKIVSSCFYQLHRLKEVRRIIDQKTAANLVTSLVLTRLDYCNAVYAGLPKSTTSFLQRVQNAADSFLGASHATTSLRYGTACTGFQLFSE